MYKAWGTRVCVCVCVFATWRIDVCNSRLVAAALERHVVAIAAATARTLAQRSKGLRQVSEARGPRNTRLSLKFSPSLFSQSVPPRKKREKGGREGLVSSESVVGSLVTP